MWDIEDLKKGTQIYVNEKIKKSPKLVLETAIVENATLTNGKISVNLNGTTYSATVLNSQSYSVNDIVKLVCNKYGDSYIELVIIGKL